MAVTESANVRYRHDMMAPRRLDQVLARRPPKYGKGGMAGASVTIYICSQWATATTPRSGTTPISCLRSMLQAHMCVVSSTTSMLLA